jgi:hypothetical protein
MACERRCETKSFPCLVLAVRPTFIGLASAQTVSQETAATARRVLVSPMQFSLFDRPMLCGLPHRLAGVGRAGSDLNAIRRINHSDMLLQMFLIRIGRFGRRALVAARHRQPDSWSSSGLEHLPTLCCVGPGPLHVSPQAQHDQQRGTAVHCCQHESQSRAQAHHDHGTRRHITNRTRISAARRTL